MKKYIATSTVALGALMPFAGQAQAAPEENGDPSATISRLRAQGYDVNINRIGNAPLEQCSVLGVRSHPVANQPIPIITDDDINAFTVNPTPKVTVSLDCSR